MWLFVNNHCENCDNVITEQDKESKFKQLESVRLGTNKSQGGSRPKAAVNLTPGLRFYQISDMAQEFKQVISTAIFEFSSVNIAFRSKITSTAVEIFKLLKFQCSISLDLFLATVLFYLTTIILISASQRF